MHLVSFSPAARFELIEAQDWYEKEVTGLGRRFRAQVEVTIAQISERPRQFPVMYKQVHRALMRKFPYAIMFVIEPDESLTVIACFHGSRDPQRWRERV